jgi:iron only hydrogenase large subunit-like protein
LSKDQVYVVDGPAEIAAGIEAFKTNENIRFLDILMCKGGCIGGPGMMSQAPLEEKVKKVYDYKQYCRKDKIGSKLGKFEHAEGLDMTRTTNN